MFVLLALLKASATRHLTELALLFVLFGGVALACASVDRFRRRGLLVGGVLVTIGFVLLIVTVHWGISPYGHKPVGAKN